MPTTQPEDYEQWMRAHIGRPWDDLTEDQRARLDRERTRLRNRYPRPEQIEHRRAGMSAAAKYLLGLLTLETTREHLVRARHAAALAVVATSVVAAMTVDDSRMPDYVAAQLAGIDRKTLLRFTGPRRPRTRLDDV